MEKPKHKARHIDSKLRFMQRAEHTRWHVNRGIVDEDCGWCMNLPLTCCEYHAAAESSS